MACGCTLPRKISLAAEKQAYRAGRGESNEAHSCYVGRREERDRCTPRNYGRRRAYSSYSAQAKNRGRKGISRMAAWLEKEDGVGEMTPREQGRWAFRRDDCQPTIPI